MGKTTKNIWKRPVGYFPSLENKGRVMAVSAPSENLDYIFYHYAAESKRNIINEKYEKKCLCLMVQLTK